MYSFSARAFPPCLDLRNYDLIGLMDEVAIIGAGPAGLASARYLASEGFAPAPFEAGSTIGRQWSGDRTRCCSAHSARHPSGWKDATRYRTPRRVY
jgi:cation diffusion facilitator CzcD-associated flavoprotein CzcO